MFLKFSVENHLSMRDRVELTLVAAKLRDFEEGLLVESALPGMQVVPSALIYGPNASGKSNLLLGLNTMCSMVINSQIGWRPDSDIPRFPFALDNTFAEKPTKLEIDFVVDNVRYNYGFSFTADAIVEEWLTAYPNIRGQMLFRRTKQDFAFGRNLKGRNQVIADLTRKNSLFLSAAAQNDHQELTGLYKYFADIEILQTISVGGYSASMQFEQGNIDDRVINFLANIGTGVVGFRKTESEKTEEIREFNRSIINLIMKQTGAESAPDLSRLDKDISIELAHNSADGSIVYFNLDRESAGTRRLLIMLSEIFEVLDRGGLIVIDEIDASLHTHACELLFTLFSSKEYNKKGAQIIATTHDTNLLSSARIRRDQIWLCEKDNHGSSNIFPLTDVHLRHTDNFEKGYLQGRFGALPFDGPVENQITNLKITTR